MLYYNIVTAICSWCVGCGMYWGVLLSFIYWIEKQKIIVGAFFVQRHLQRPRCPESVSNRWFSNSGMDTLITVTLHERHCVWDHLQSTRLFRQQSVQESSKVNTKAALWGGNLLVTSGLLSQGAFGSWCRHFDAIPGSLCALQDKDNTVIVRRQSLAH